MDIRFREILGLVLVIIGITTLFLSYILAFIKGLKDPKVGIVDMLFKVYTVIYPKYLIAGVIGILLGLLGAIIY